ncbi:MAG: aminomethyl transferase family protein [Acidobacteria bacterium]|nr:MAG: aminomethyl transferase family protein [Acidobacteriota bacterium]
MEQSFLEQYAAVRQWAGILNLGPRRKLNATGEDHVQFLHAMISNDVLGLVALQGRHGTLLRPTGKLVAVFYYYRFPDHVLIDIAPSVADSFLQTVQKLIVMDDVSIEDVSNNWGHLSVSGPKSGDLIRAVLNTPGPDHPLGLVQVVWRGEVCWLIRKSDLADEGFEIIAPASIGDDLRKELVEPRQDFSPLEITKQVADLLRLERGVPVFGVDMNESNNPIEVGLDDAISLNKGCYVGQEVVSKATYVGGVSRYLRSLSVMTEKPVRAGAEVLVEEGKRVGHVTSAAFSPALGQTVALAYVKRDYAEPGRRLRIETEQGTYEAAVAQPFRPAEQRGAIH